MLYLTLNQHKKVVENLVNLAKESKPNISLDKNSFAFTSLMHCLLLHNVSVAEALIRLYDSLGGEWFPVTAGYAIVRTMFEADVNSHYIALNPQKHSDQYIKFSAVLNKKRMDACHKHIKTPNPGLIEGMEILWNNYWALKENEVNKKFNEISSEFTHSRSKKLFTTWSGLSFKDMAIKVDHEEAYDIFYAELSSFAHANINLADRFLKNQQNAIVWSQRSDESDVANIFRYAATFLTCNLEFISSRFSFWKEIDVKNCWNVIDKGQ